MKHNTQFAKLLIDADAHLALAIGLLSIAHNTSNGNETFHELTLGEAIVQLQGLSSNITHHPAVIAELAQPPFEVL